MLDKNEKQIYNLTSQEVLQKCNSTEKGLENEEAKKRLGEYGLNKIQKKQSWKELRILARQFDDALVWILLVAAGLAFLFSELRDVTIILIIVLTNALIGFLQEFKAERILDSIKKLTSDRALVVRDGEKQEIDTKFIVPGDIVFVSAGDSISADGYILESYYLKVNSFVFTGESLPEHKSAKVINQAEVAFADIDNMVFMGETVAAGEASFMVTATGMKTELGKIAHLTAEVQEGLTPMQLQMRKLGRNVTILAILIGAIVITTGQYFQMSLYQNFLFALALSVSVVPEGLPAAISMALSFGMRNLLKNDVLAKKLNAVETLGSVSVICTDKTGTITKNELTVVKAVVNNEVIDITGVGYTPEGEFFKGGRKIDPKRVLNLETIFKIGALCNDASLVKEEEKEFSFLDFIKNIFERIKNKGSGINTNAYKIIGDPTEGAIVVASRKFNSEKGFYESGERKVTEIPFSSERMRMSVAYKNHNLVSYAKGSPDVMVDLCKFQKIGDNIVEFTEKDKNSVRELYNKMSSQALRVLAFAYRPLDNEDEKNITSLHEKMEKELIWVGLMAMMDPPRQDVSTAIKECRELGIRVIMITGDYEVTAKAIAQSIGLIEKNREGNKFVINGKTLDGLKDREMYQRIRSGVCVFARIAPEQKLRIASVLKKYKEIIAMTGDGVNDAPALRQADIGVAMGIIGTDVSKEASDMILMDDNFSSIIQGVKQGRTVFSNLKKFVHYVFTSNASELFTVIFGVLLHIPAPISAVQILAIDLGTDIFPSFSLGMEPPEPGKTKKAINSRESIMSFSGFRRVAYLGLIMAVGATVTFLWSMIRGGWSFGENIAMDSVLYIKSTTAAYAVLSMTQMANLLQSRSEKYSPFKLGFFKNKYVWGAIFLSVGILISFMYLPVLKYYLGMSPIDGTDWFMVLVFTAAVFIWEEGRKENAKFWNV